MATEDDHDEFEGIDVSGPWGGVRIGSGRVRRESDGDPEYRAIRRRVRQRLEFVRHVATYVFVVSGLTLLDWLTGGGWWAPWVAAIWGGILLLQFFTTFVSPLLWGRDVEERMVLREIERRRGQVSVTREPDEGGQ